MRLVDNVFWPDLNYMGYELTYEILIVLKKSSNPTLHFRDEEK